MATNHPSGLKVPVRPAPAPPGRQYFQQAPSSLKPMSNLMDDWDMSFVDTFSKRESVQSAQWQSNQIKKVPPPRPPPPKIAMTSNSKKYKHLSKPQKTSSKQLPSRPSELLTNLFTRRGQKAELSGQPPSLGVVNRGAAPSLPSAVVTASLIDLSSPPSSPTPTTRSSSDGLSVDSFGSDGTTSHSHHHSQVESGFEDDSDLFGGFTATPSPIQRDPWTSSSSTPSDIFSPVNPVATTSLAKSPWSTLPQDPFSPPRRSNCTPSPTPAPHHVAPTPGVLTFKPTIIRPKVKTQASPSLSRSKAMAHPNRTSVLEDSEGDNRSESPPMPSVPPPAPPVELLAELDNVNVLQGNEECIRGPHCVGLFNFEASQPDDLSFKEGDIIELLREVNEDWMYGRCQGREGMFPANFVKIIAPINEPRGAMATAIYKFTPESWEDLDLQEGSKVRLLGRINDDWLYGECDGKQGQFPVTFVDYVPPNLPMHFS